MQTISKFFTLLLVVLVTSVAATAQCETWVGSAMEGKATDAHVSYRNFVKDKNTPEELAAIPKEDLQVAFDKWQEVFEIAPAADGKRATHYRDGRMLYKAMAINNPSKKADYAKEVVKLYDQQLKCYPDEEAYLLGRKGYDMFYQGGYSLEAIDVLDQAMQKGGDKTEYIVLVPLGQLMAYFFEQEQIDAARVRDLYERGVALADVNVAAGGDYAQYYESGRQNLQASLKKFENDIFDCAYFKDKLQDEFKDNMDNLKEMQKIMARLKLQGCPDNDPFIAKVQAQYDAVYSERKEEFEEERRASNPAFAAQEAANNGNYSEAVSLYEDAIAKSDDDERKALYYYQIAQLQYGKLGQYSSARSSANQAASLRSGWGKPYILIGDIYTKMSSGCGDAYEQRLAVLAAIDKYQYAKSIDGESASDANRRVGRLSESMPIKGDAFSRGDKKGDRIKVGCGIGETVTLRFN